MTDPGQGAEADEIERDRRAERWVIAKALVALVVVGLFVLLREIYLR